MPLRLSVEECNVRIVASVDNLRADHRAEKECEVMLQMQVDEWLSCDEKKVGHAERLRRLRVKYAE